MLFPAGAAVRRFAALFILCAVIGVPAALMLYPQDFHGLKPAVRFLGWAFLALVALSPITVLFEIILSHWFENGGSGNLKLKNFLVRTKSLAARAWSSFLVRAVVFLALFLSLANLCSSYNGIDAVFKVLGGSIAMVMIVYALSRATFLIFLVIAAAAVLAGTRIRRFPKSPACRFCLFIWILISLSIAYFDAYRIGPKESACRKVYSQPGVEVVLDRSRMRTATGHSTITPYDCVPVQGGRYIVASMKDIVSWPGALIKIDVERRDVAAVLPTDFGFPEFNGFPERLAVNEEKEEVYALFFNPGNYQLLVLDSSGSDLRLKKSVPLPGEPTFIAVNPVKRNIAVMLTDNPPVSGVVFNMDTFEPVHFVPKKDKADANLWVVLSDGYEKAYQTSVAPGKKLFELETDGYSPVRSGFFLLPFYGITLDEGRDRLYVSSPLTYSVTEIDSRTFRKTGSIPLAGGICDLDIDTNAGLLFSASYTGELQIVDLKNRKVKRQANLGRLLRNIHFDRKTGRIYACTGCGVFVLNPSPDARSENR